MSGLRWYQYRQNNSGGQWVPPYLIVWVRALSAGAANAVAADEAGVYFDGVESGQDCPCCGDRWSAPWGEEGEDSPDLRRWSSGFDSLYREVPKVLLIHADGNREEKLLKDLPSFRDVTP